MPIEELAWGVAAGSVALVAIGGAPLIARRRGRAFTPELGLPLVAAALVALVPTGSVAAWSVLGVTGVAAVSTVGAARRSILVHAAALTPFAIALALDAPGEPWVRLLVVATASVGAALVARTCSLAGWAPLGAPLLALTVVAVFVAVPDTEEAATLLGATAVIALRAWPVGRLRIDPAGAAATTALLAWVVAVGGRGRPPSIVGAMAGLGLLAAAPVGRWLRRSMPRPARQPLHWTASALAAHGVLALILARTAGTTTHLAVAVPIALVGATAAVASAWLLAVRSPEPDAGPGSAPRTSRRP
jgi:hypothetical protein